MPAPGVTLIEMFNQGLVTARDPSLLRPGEMQRCNNTIYHPNDGAIWKSPGRTLFNGTAVGDASTAIKGLRELQFDTQSTANDGSLITYVASASGSYYHAKLATSADPPTGSFALLASAVGDGPTIDSIHYNGKFYILNGNQDAIMNKVIIGASADGGLPTIRRHGLTPVQTCPLLASAAGAGWPTPVQDFGDGYYFFITTEVYDADGPDEVESTWSGTTAKFDVAQNLGVILMSGTANGVTVTKPATVNAEATSWRIYFHGPEQSPTFDYSMLSTFYLVGTESIATTSKRLGTIVLVQGPLLPTTGTGTGDNPSFITTYGSNAGTIDATGETLIGSNFGFATAGIAGGTIYGIEYEMSARLDGGSSYAEIALSWDNGTSYTTAQHFLLVNSGDYNVYKTGSPIDTWGRTWSTAGSTEFVNGAFTAKATYRSYHGGTPDMDVDWVTVKINYGGASSGAPINKAGRLFPYVAIQVGPIITTVGANFPPSVASTGDVYEGQMVLNDVLDPSLIRYSLPDGVDYFPEVYFINFETKERDEVTYIRRLGEKLVVGLKHQIYRVNYLPRSEDSEFDRGRCYEAIAENHGIMGTHCGTLFTPPDRPQLLAYVSSNGIHATDGFTTTTVSEDLAWEQMVNVKALHKSVLVDYPKYYSLVLYYIPANITDGATVYPTKAMWFNYHPSHIKEGGKALVTGPNDVVAASSHVSKFLDKPIMWTGNTNGKVYVEDQAWTDAFGTGVNVDIVTRDIYAAGIGWEWTLERVWIRHFQHISPTTQVQFDLYWRNTEGEFIHPTAAGTGQWTTKSFTTARGAVPTGSIANLANAGALSRIDAHAIGESMIYRFTEANGLNGLGMSYMALEVAGHGLEEKR